VEEALNIVGAQKFDRKVYFRLLNTRVGERVSRTEQDDAEGEVQSERRKGKGRAENCTDSENDDEDDETDPGGDDDESDAAIDLPSRTIHRDIYPPFIRLPLQQPPSPLCSDGSQETDISEDEALITQLNEEEELDIQDQKREIAYQRELWSTFGADMTDDGSGKGIRHTLRFRQATTDGHVKSQVYIEDSD
jgi:hypothetical protein